MRRVTTNDFEQGDWVEYSADGIRLINDIRRITRPDNDSVTIDMTIVVVCLKGRMTVTIDSTQHTLTHNHMLFLQPNSVVTDYQLSDDFTSRTLVFSLATIENSIYLRRKIWDNISYLRLNPIVPLSDDDISIFKHYYGIATANMQAADDNLYKQEIISHLLRSLVYEFLLLTDRIIVGSKNQVSSRKQTSNDDLHRRFLELLAFSCGRTRKVEQFAEQLFVTPDQLTAATKAVSGRTALDWITEATVKAITHELLYTQKSVSEISDELDFPSLSFFGKYFKQHTGLSPRAFRERFWDGLLGK
ncbi:MAG: AraC family transcriptional regulator [Bacteroidales bacterium]|nr:AraC family transcriptional regulator [Bacteroidales bacterium]